MKKGNVDPKFDPKRSDRSGNKGRLHRTLKHPGYWSIPRKAVRGRGDR